MTGNVWIAAALLPGLLLLGGCDDKAREFAAKTKAILDQRSVQLTKKIAAEVEAYSAYAALATEDHRNLVYLGPDKAQYTSISSRYLATGVRSVDLASGLWSIGQFDPTAPSDFSGFIAKVNSLPNKASFYQKFDVNGDGTISQIELGQALVFDSSAGNPNGQINYYRVQMTQEGPQDTKSRGYSLYGQDEFTLNRWTFNVGVRAERFGHFATTGDKIYAFPWTIAPRLSAVWDVKGDGSQKAAVYWGRYFDPIRNDMTNFAGTLTGAILEEQVYANGQWVTYRTRGGATTQDGFFSATTRTPCVSFAFFVKILITPFTALAPQRAAPGPRRTSIRSISSMTVSCTSQ